MQWQCPTEIASSWAEIGATIALVATFCIVYYYARQVKESVGEMRRHRQSLFWPIVVCEDVTPRGEETAVDVWSTFNFGKGPAINVRARIEDAKYEMEEQEWRVISDRWLKQGEHRVFVAKEGKKPEPFELKEGAERGALIFTYEDMENHKMETRIEFWKEDVGWVNEVMWAGKRIRGAGST